MSSDSLQPALPGERNEIHGHAGTISFYADAPLEFENSTPLLLIHTINAAAGAHEIRPLYEHYRHKRPVYALDLPGYGFSERSDRDYTPRLMTDAIHAVTRTIQDRRGQQAIDALAVSTSCEFLARAACESATDYRTLALVAPTGFNKLYPYRGKALSNRGMPGFLRFLKRPYAGKPLFNLLTSRPSIRFFLQKTWGSRNIDETMYEYSCHTARQPGAQYAPFYFLSGYLFSQDINGIYEGLQQPVWMCHGVRGDFTNYCWKETLRSKRNWQFTEFETGALPYFEILEKFCLTYDRFSAGAKSLT